MTDLEHRIGRDTYVVLDYVLYDDDGDVIEATDDEGGRPIGFVWGYGSLVPGLEAALAGMRAGETREVVVPPEDGYGAHDPALEQWVDRDDFPGELALDDEFEAEDDRGEEIRLRVVELSDDAVLVDANHPLAGETLNFDVMIRSVRPATAEELAGTKHFSPRKQLRLAPEPSESGEHAGSPEQEPSMAEAPAELVSAPDAHASPSQETTKDKPSPEMEGKTQGKVSGRAKGTPPTHPHGKGLRRGREPSALPAELDDEQ